MQPEMRKMRILQRRESDAGVVMRERQCVLKRKDRMVPVRPD